VNAIEFLKIKFLYRAQYEMGARDRGPIYDKGSEHVMPEPVAQRWLRRGLATIAASLLMLLVHGQANSATLTLFDEFMNHLGQGKHDLSANTFKAMLTNTAPDKAANTVKADITEISAGNGYTAGGATLASCTWSETSGGSGIWRFTCADPSFTASGGSIATHRYLVIYNDTQTSPADPLIGFVDRGSSDIIADGNTRTWDIGASGLFEIDATP
jgi:hypothetical protein